MGMIFTIAIRSIGRHKRRTMLSAITIAVGLTVFIFMDSLLSGVNRISIDNMIDLSTGALKIQTARYDMEKSAFPLDYGLQDSAAALERALLGDKRVTHATRRTRFLGQLSNYTETVPVVGTVIDEAADTAVFKLKPCIQGGYFSADNRREILLGGRLAQELGVAVGDNITLYALTKYGSRNADEFKIVGLLGTADPAINQSAVFITYGAANDFLDLENTVTEIDAAMVRIGNLADFEKAAMALQKARAALSWNVDRHFCRAWRGSFAIDPCQARVRHGVYARDFDHCSGGDFQYGFHERLRAHPRNRSAAGPRHETLRD